MKLKGPGREPRVSGVQAAGGREGASCSFFDLSIVQFRSAPSDEFLSKIKSRQKRWAKKLCLIGVVDSFELGTEYSIVEASVPFQYIGKSIGEIKMREKYNLLVLTTIKQTMIESKVGKNVTIPKVQGVANPDTVLEKDDILVLFGFNKDIQSFLKKG